MTVSLPSDFVVHNFWQLNEFRRRQFGHDAGDCTPSTVGEILDIQSMGNYDVGIRPYGSPAPSLDAQNKKRADFIALARKRGGASLEQGMDGRQALVAVRSFAAEFAAVNRKPPGGTLLWPGDWTTVVLPALQAGKWVKGAGYYSVIDAYNSHQISGAWGATESHSILVGQLRAISGVDHVTWLDTTCDGRISAAAGGRQVPRGPQTVPLSVFKAFCDSYKGTNEVYGFFFEPRGLITPVVPGSDPHVVTAISVANPTHVTAQASFTGEGLVTGDYVTFSGTNSTPALAGPYAVTVLDATHFTVPVNVTVIGSAGSWVESNAPDVQPAETPFDPCDAPGPQPN